MDSTEYGTKYFRVKGIATSILSGGGMTLVDREEPTNKINVNGLAKDGNDLDSLFTWLEGKLSFTNPVNFDDQFDAGEGDEIQIVAILTDSGLEGYLEKVISSETALNYLLTTNIGEHGKVQRVDVQMVTIPQEDGTTSEVYHVVENSYRGLPTSVGYGEEVYFVAEADEDYAIDTVKTTINGISAIHYEPLGNDQGLALYSLIGGVGDHEIDVTFRWANPDFPEPSIQESSISELLASETSKDDNYYRISGIVESFDEQNPKLGGMTLLDPTTHESLHVTGLSAEFSEDDFAFDSETGKLSYTNPETFATLFPEDGEPAIEAGDVISVVGIATEDGFQGGFESVVTENEQNLYDISVQSAVNGSLRLVDAHYDEEKGAFVIDGDRATTTAYNGQIVYFEAVPEEGYEISKILINDKEASLSVHNEEGTLYSFTMGLFENSVAVEFVEKDPAVDPSESIQDIALSDLLAQENDRSQLYRVTGVIRGERTGFGTYSYTLYDSNDTQISMLFSYLSKAQKDSEGNNVFQNVDGQYRIDSSDDNFSDLFGTEVLDGSTCTFVVAVDSTGSAYGYFEKLVSGPAEVQMVPITIEVTDYYGEGSVYYYDADESEIEKPTELEDGSSFKVMVVGAQSFVTIEVNGETIVDAGENYRLYEIPVDGPTNVTITIF